MINADDTGGPDLTRTTPDRVRAAILAALDGGASGIVLGDKYAQMRFDDLSGVGAAIAERKLRPSRTFG